MTAESSKSHYVCVVQRRIPKRFSKYKLLGFYVFNLTDRIQARRSTADSICDHWAYHDLIQRVDWKLSTVCIEIGRTLNTRLCLRERHRDFQSVQTICKRIICISHWNKFTNKFLLQTFCFSWFSVCFVLLFSSKMSGTRYELQGPEKFPTKFHIIRGVLSAIVRPWWWWSDRFVIL